MEKADVFKVIEWSKFALPCEIVGVNERFSSKRGRNYIYDYDVKVAIKGEIHVVKMDKAYIEHMTALNRINVFNYRFDSTGALRPRTYGNGVCLKRMEAVKESITNIYNNETENNIVEQRGLKKEKFKLIQGTQLIKGKDIHTLDILLKINGNKLISLMFQELTVKDRYCITMITESGVREWYIEAEYNNGYASLNKSDVIIFMKSIDEVFMQYSE